MNDYRLIACDLDGTLMGTDLRLSEENLQAMKELTRQGVLIVPATGRTICEMREIFDLPEIRYVIYSNGAAIFDKKTGKSIILGLEGDTLGFVFDTVLKYDTFVVIHKDGKTYADKKKASELQKYHVSVNVEYLVNEYCTLVDDFEEQLPSRDVESVVVCFSNGEDVDACRKILSSNPDLHTAEAWEYNLEIFFKDAGKGSALEILAHKLNLGLENIISIGDSDNDRQMTSMSGLGLVTENGCDSLKEIADKVICSNDEHVMRYVKNHYFS